MADNVQPGPGEEREASSTGLLLSTDPLQGEVGYKLSADDDTSDADNGDDDDYNTDNGDSDNGDSDNGDDSDDGGPLVVEIGPGASDGKDSDGTDESDPDYSDN
jgi:hypothetical protein